MLIKFKYRDESPFLLPGYSRYSEVIGLDGEKHVGMIHLAHKDWKGVWTHGEGDKTFTLDMPAEVEITIRATSIGHIAGEKHVGQPDVSRGKGVAERPEEKSKKGKAPAPSRLSAKDKARKRGNK